MTHALRSESVADTVYRVVTGYDEDAARILDRSIPMSDSFVLRLVEEATLGIEGRNPRVRTLSDGSGLTTDLDLLSTLSHLAGSSALIEIPAYLRYRPEGVPAAEEWRIGERRFGNIVGLVPNRRVFSFSVMIKDMSVAQGQRPGAYRNFLVVDPTGAWNPGLREINIRPTPEDQGFLDEIGMLQDGRARFGYYLHPNRRQSMYGAPYLRLKMLEQRLMDDMRFWRSEMTRIRNLGIGAPIVHTPREPLARTTTRRIKVNSMVAVLDMPPFVGSHTREPNTEFGLKRALDQLRLIRSTLLPRVRFVTRADEAAFFRFGGLTGFRAPWARELTWRRYTPPYSSMSWQRMRLTRDAALRYRTFTCMEEIAA